MTHKVYRQNAKIMIREWIKFFERSETEKNRKKINKIEKEDKYYSKYSTCPDKAIDHIICRIPKNSYCNYCEILFGFKSPFGIKYDVLKLEMTELGVVPTEFISRKRKINLYSLLDLKKENPYEDIFNTLKKHFNEKSSYVNAEYIEYLCADSKKFMVNHGVNKDDAYFLEKRKNMLISLDNF